jgi:hypothetical protein
MGIGKPNPANCSEKALIASPLYTFAWSAKMKYNRKIKRNTRGE